MEELDKKDVSKKKSFDSLRWVMVVLTFCSYASIFFLRNSIGVIVVAMVNATSMSDDEVNNTKDSCPAALNKNNSDSKASDGEYEWTLNEQGIVLGAYFWGFVISRLLFSRFAEKFGQRQTISLNLTISGFLAFSAPYISSFSPYALAAIRFVTGLLFGPFPAQFTSFVSAWAPRNELGVMTTSAFSGTTVGALIGLFAAGWLTDNIGWRIVFYVAGVLVIIVAPFWIIIARNSPFDHPWLSDNERKLLMGNINMRTKKSVPWRKLITSPYVAICIYANLAASWLDVIMNNEGPSYFKYKIGLDLDNASYVIGMSNFASLIFLITFGRISDFIINKNYLSKLNARKFFHLIGVGGIVIMLLGLVIAKCSAGATITLWITLGIVASATACSFLLSVIDIAPNYIASIHSLLALGNIGAALTPTLTAAFLNQGNGWNKSFYLAAGINFVSLVVYEFFMTAEAQPWNFEDGNQLERDSSIYVTKF